VRSCGVLPLGRRLPDVRAQLPALDRAVRGGLDPLGEVGTANMDAGLVVLVESAVHAGNVDLAQVREGLGRQVSRENDPHAPNVAQSAMYARGIYRMGSEIVKSLVPAHHESMARPKNPELPDTWPQRARFVELLDAKLAEGVDLHEIAEALGLPKTRSLEHEYRYSKSRRPSRGTIELAAKYFGVSTRELDGPVDDEFERARLFLIDACGEGRVETLTRQQALDAYRTMKAVAITMLGKNSDEAAMVRTLIPKPKKP